MIGYNICRNISHLHKLNKPNNVRALNYFSTSTNISSSEERQKLIDNMRVVINELNRLSSLVEQAQKYDDRTLCDDLIDISNFWTMYLHAENSELKVIDRAINNLRNGIKFHYDKPISKNAEVNYCMSVISDKY